MSSWPERVFASALALALGGAGVASALGQGTHGVVLDFLGVVALAHTWVGVEQVVPRRGMRATS